jgi:hypothetical protein
MWDLERGMDVWVKLDLVWTFMVWIDDSAWFLKVVCCLSCSLLWFSWRSFEDDFLGILLGVTYDDIVPLWLVTLPSNIFWLGLDLVAMTKMVIYCIHMHALASLFAYKNSQKYVGTWRSMLFKKKTKKKWAHEGSKHNPKICSSGYLWD